MRIAVVTTSYPRTAEDPAGHFVRAEVEALVQAGHQVTVLAPAPQPLREKHTTVGNSREGPTVHWLPSGDAFGYPGALTRFRRAPWRALAALRFARQARRLLSRRGAPFDRVIAHWFLPAGWPIAHGLGVPLEIVIHGTDARLLFAMPGFLARHCVARATQGPVELRFVSQALQDEFTNRFDPARRLHTRVEPCRIDVPALAREAARHELGLPLGAPIALVVARLIAGKRVARALRCPDLPPETQWVVVGDGPLRTELEREFPNVAFLGQLDRARTLHWIAAADVLVNASVEEGAPTVIREARQLGTAVLTPAVGDVRTWAARDAGIRLLEE